MALAKLSGFFHFVICRNCQQNYCFFDRWGNFDDVANGKIFGWCGRCKKEWGI